MQFNKVKSVLSAATYYIPLLPRVGTRFKPTYGELKLSEFYGERGHIRSVQIFDGKRVLASSEASHFWYGTLARCTFWSAYSMSRTFLFEWDPSIELYFHVDARVPVAMCAAAALCNLPRIRAARLAAASDSTVKGYPHKK